MALLEIHTNQSLTNDERLRLMRTASAHVAELLGKPESYVMVIVESDASMLFAGDDAPLAYLELKSIGLPDDATPNLSAALCQWLHEELAIATDRIYIEFSNAERHLWGWDGRTF